MHLGKIGPKNLAPLFTAPREGGAMPLTQLRSSNH